MLTLGGLRIQLRPVGWSFFIFIFKKPKHIKYKIKLKNYEVILSSNVNCKLN